MLQIDKDENNIAYIFEKSKNKKTADAISDKISYCETAGKNDFKSIDVDDPYYFALAPRPLKEKERMTLFVSGEAGAGKSHYTREFAKRYNQMFPNNPIYLISYLDEDATLDAYKKIKRIKAFDNEFLNNCMKLDLKTEFKNTLVIFDDIDSVANKKVKDVIYGFLFKLLKIGRHSNTSVAYIGHELYAEHKLKNVLNESMYITFFPRYLNFKKSKYLLSEYFGLSKQQIERIQNIKNSRFITYIKGSDKIILSEKEMFLL